MTLPRRAAAVIAVAACMGSCARRPSVPMPSAPLVNAAASACRAAAVPVEWLAPAPLEARELHDIWCATVGPPIIDVGIRATGDAGEAAHETPRPLTIISWNTHGGVADVDALLRALRARAVPRMTGDLVLLLQEVVRRSPAVPSRVPDAAPAPGSLHGPGHGEDVQALAARLGFSLVYVPSMRNGAGPRDGQPGEDRGNAILSSLPLSDPAAIELPLHDQRRVAVAATIRWRGAAGQPPAGLRVVSFHFDTTGGRGDQSAFLGHWLQRAAGKAIVAGGDVNALRGTRDAAYEALAEAVPVEACGRGRTNRWPWGLHAMVGWWRGRVDYMFSTLAQHGTHTSCATWPEYFGSDHLPVVLDAHLAFATARARLRRGRPKTAD